MQHNFCFSNLLKSFDRVSGVSIRYVWNSELKSTADCEDLQEYLVILALGMGMKWQIKFNANECKIMHLMGETQ